jgi:hypothetical protein
MPKWLKWSLVILGLVVVVGAFASILVPSQEVQDLREIQDSIQESLEEIDTLEEKSDRNP